MNAPITADRFLRLPGTLNLRDFGGYRTSDGRMVRRGHLFRCGALNAVENHDEFAALGIGVIIDLRRDDEVAMSPTPAHPPYHVRVHIPIAPGSHTLMRESYADPASNHEDRIRFMAEITREIARDHVDAYREMFRHLLEVDGGFLIHCSAGKDRTGFGAAMIQALLGVPEDVIIEDYLLSNQATELYERMAPRMLSQQPNLDEESIRVLAGVREEYLRGALEEVERHFGGFDGYFEAVGLTEREISELRRRYLD